MTNDFDTRGEFMKVYPYCRESFVAGHLSRFYCPDKNGRKKFCKNRQKRINDNLRKSGSVLIVNENNPIKVFIEEPEIKERNINQLIINTQKSKKNTEVTEDKLLKKGFDLKLFDSFEETKSGVKMFYQFYLLFLQL